MPARLPLARFLRLTPCMALLQGCAAILGSKSTNTSDSPNPAVVAAEPGRDSATAPQPAIQPFQPNAPNEIVSERVKRERQRAVDDMLRTNLVTTVEQGPLGILRVGVGERFHTHQAREYYFTQVAFAYHTWQVDGRPLIIELWEKGGKIGQYSDRAFHIGPDYTTPLGCPEGATSGLCGSLGKPGEPAVAARDQAAVPSPRTSPAGKPAPGAPTVKARDRSGFHFGAGLGGGAMDFACDGCDFASQTGVSGFLSAAGSLGVKTLVGVEGTGWTKSPAQVYSLTAFVTEYLSATRGLFLSAGVGVVGYREDTDLGDLSASAFGFSGRLGYEFGRGPVKIVPYLGIVRTFGGADMKRDGEDADLNVAISNLQFGLSIAAY